ncbi:hypothetical protein Ctob_014260 [Chrysochromulina tobinii]|uniref:UVR domain-containing protein n=1 Tax=Chrysochromulina tobinii TaxID=1460289 RepID=A0A0M0K908_9EUKA|nr:hypothetical protein Ctob_014260 [Chrysochromulina tobinii]|eukprot:KOO35310.1 hypothetical protein Ctob_014260 [Chrysochromulina sp. CCMP291]
MEAAQLEATAKDEFEVAEALEEPLRTARAELGAAHARLASATAALHEYRLELLAASGAALEELQGTALQLVRSRDEQLAQVAAMREAAREASAAASEWCQGEAERLALDTARLREDEAELASETEAIEGQIREAAAPEDEARASWLVKHTAAQAKVEELRAMLAAALVEEAECARQVARHDEKLTAVRASFEKPLAKLGLRRDALLTKLGALEHAGAELARQRRERVASWHAARGEVAAKSAELRALRERYVALRAERETRRAAARLLRLVCEHSRASEQATAASRARLAPTEEEAAAVSEALGAVRTAALGHKAELEAVREALKSLAERQPELVERKRAAAAAREFKLAGLVAVELKAMAAEEEALTARQEALRRQTLADDTSILVLGAAEAEAREEARRQRAAADVRLSRLLAAQQRIGRRMLDEALAEGKGEGGREADSGAVLSAEQALLRAHLDALAEWRAALVTARAPKAGDGGVGEPEAQVVEEEAGAVVSACMHGEQEAQVVVAEEEAGEAHEPHRAVVSTCMHGEADEPREPRDDATDATDGDDRDDGDAAAEVDDSLEAWQPAPDTALDDEAYEEVELSAEAPTVATSTDEASAEAERVVAAAVAQALLSTDDASVADAADAADAATASALVGAAVARALQEANPERSAAVPALEAHLEPVAELETKPEEPNAEPSESSVTKPEEPNAEPSLSSVTKPEETNAEPSQSGVDAAAGAMAADESAAAAGVSAAEVQAMRARVGALDEAIDAACADEDYDLADELETARRELTERLAKAEVATGDGEWL